MHRIVGKRISLDSVVYAYRDGISPEGIVQLFPALTLEEVYGSIAFYLANRAIVAVSRGNDRLSLNSAGLIAIRSPYRHRSK